MIKAELTAEKRLAYEKPGSDGPRERILGDKTSGIEDLVVLDELEEHSESFLETMPPQRPATRVVQCQMHHFGSI